MPADPVRVTSSQPGALSSPPLAPERGQRLAVTARMLVDDAAKIDAARHRAPFRPATAMGTIAVSGPTGSQFSSLQLALWRGVVTYSDVDMKVLEMPAVRIPRPTAMARPGTARDDHPRGTGRRDAATAEQIAPFNVHRRASSDVVTESDTVRRLRGNAVLQRLLRLRYRHEGEDEFLLVLSGVSTVIEEMALRLLLSVMPPAGLPGLPTGGYHAGTARRRRGLPAAARAASDRGASSSA